MNQSNPYQAPHATQQSNQRAEPNQPSNAPQIDWVRVLALAKAQNFVCNTLLAVLILTALGFFMRRSPSLAAQGLGVFALLIVGILQAVAMYQLAQRSYRSSAIGVMVVLLSIFPGLGLIALLAVNQKATAQLKSVGVPVGLMGPSRATISGLERAAQDFSQSRAESAAKQTHESSVSAGAQPQDISAPPSGESDE